MFFFVLLKSKIVTILPFLNPLFILYQIVLSYMFRVNDKLQKCFWKADANNCNNHVAFRRARIALYKSGSFFFSTVRLSCKLTCIISQSFPSHLALSILGVTACNSLKMKRKLNDPTNVVNFFLSNLQRKRASNFSKYEIIPHPSTDITYSWCFDLQKSEEIENKSKKYCKNMNHGINCHGINNNDQSDRECSIRMGKLSAPRQKRLHI